MIAVETGAGRLVGVLPLVLSGSGRRALLRFAGFNLGDRFEPACAVVDEDRVAAAAAGLLARTGPRRLMLDNCAAGASWIAELRRGVGRVTELTDRSAELPAIALEDGWDAWLASRSRNFRSQIGRKARGLERDHEVAVSICDEPAKLETAMQAFFTLHDARWDERGGSGSLTERSRRFHIDFAGRALERGWLRLYLMRVDDAPAAALYGWLVDGTFGYYLAGLDPTRPQLSAGFVLLSRTIEDAAKDGASTYDLLLGDEDYKARFATRVEMVETTLIAPPRSMVMVLARLEQSARRLARRMPDGPRGLARRLFASIAGRLPGGRAR